jgi:hypothetical protein
VAGFEIANHHRDLIRRLKGVDVKEGAQFSTKEQDLTGCDKDGGRL